MPLIGFAQAPAPPPAPVGNPVVAPASASSQVSPGIAPSAAATQKTTVETTTLDTMMKTPTSSYPAFQTTARGFHPSEIPAFKSFSSVNDSIFASTLPVRHGIWRSGWRPEENKGDEFR